MFERGFDKLTKLDIVEFDVGEGHSNVFFIGKTYIDDNGTHTFAHIFTLVFEE